MLDSAQILYIEILEYPENFRFDLIIFGYQFG